MVDWKAYPFPTKPSEWERAHKDGPSVHRLTDVFSASKISIEQYLALKILWNWHDPGELYSNKWAAHFGSSSKAIREEAKKMTKEDQQWQRYLGLIQQQKKSDKKWAVGMAVPKELGAYSTAFNDTLDITELPNDDAPDVTKVVSTPRKTRSQALKESGGLVGNTAKRQLQFGVKKPESPGIFQTPETDSPAYSSKSDSIFVPEFETPGAASRKDEEIVNRALINFLTALFVGKDRDFHCDSTRKQFHIPPSEESDGFVARTDGHFRLLRVHKGNRSTAIIEVKARQRPTRGSTNRAIEMQEGTQMALWICTEPASHWPGPASKDQSAASITYHRILISQDKDDIYVTLAEYAIGYIEYLKNPQVDIANAPFLVMHTFGPFPILDAEMIENLAATLHIMIPYATKETMRSIESPGQLVQQMMDLTVGTTLDQEFAPEHLPQRPWGPSDIAGQGQRNVTEDPQTPTGRPLRHTSQGRSNFGPGGHQTGGGPIGSKGGTGGGGGTAGTGAAFDGNMAMRRRSPELPLPPNQLPHAYIAGDNRTEAEEGNDLYGRGRNRHQQSRRTIRSHPLDSISPERNVAQSSDPMLVNYSSGRVPGSRFTSPAQLQSQSRSLSSSSSSNGSTRKLGSSRQRTPATTTQWPGRSPSSSPLRRRA